MDLIGVLREVLDQRVEQTSFVLTDVGELNAGTDERHGYLEYRGALNDGRIVLLGIYQMSARRTISAEMWSPSDVRGMSPAAGIASVAMHHHVWSYDPGTDGGELSGTIVAEVTAWLQSFGPTSGPDARASSA